MSEVEFLVKLRDAAAMIADACEDYLGTKAPVEVREFGDFNGLKWTEKAGGKGPYEQTTREANNNSKEFQVLQGKLKEKGGFYQTKGYKFWDHQNNQDVIDRRAKPHNPHNRMEKNINNVKKAGQSLLKS